MQAQNLDVNPKNKQVYHQALIVATINTISHSRPVHHGTFFKVLIDKFCGCKCREIIIFAHNYFKKQNTDKATLCLVLQSSIFFS